MEKREGLKLDSKVRLLKYAEDITPYAEKGLEEEFYKKFKPLEVKESEHNVALNEGINQIFALICGVGSIFYNNATARIGVGNGTTAAAAAQTGLQGGTYAFAAMETGFPSLGAQKAIFKASFGAAEANFPWYEWTVDNGATSDKNLNRKQESLGTKSSGTWTLEVEISAS